MKLVLFDIDGTLIDSGGAGVKSLNLAFRDLFCLDNAFKGISMAGKTDTQIIREGLAKHGVSTGNGLIPQVVESYLGHLAVQINNDRKQLKPNVREVLDILAAQGGSCYLGLLTGNIERGARIKLDPFSLNAYFPSGAFGDDDEDRNRLLPVAQQRYRAMYGTEIDFHDCVVVGDTPRDVECAKRYGAACIAVATGPYPAESLIHAGADAVMEDLSDADAFLRALE